MDADPRDPRGLRLSRSPPGRSSRRRGVRGRRPASRGRLATTRSGRSGPSGRLSRPPPAVLRPTTKVEAQSAAPPATVVKRAQTGSLVVMHAADVEGFRAQAEQAPSPEALASIAGQFPRLLEHLVERGESARSIGALLSSLGETTTRRLLVLAEDDLGRPPVAYAFIVAGSLARGEQIAGSDQDNGMILDDAYDPDRHGVYFSRLAERVCDGLAECGYAYCPGDIMASNPRWRQPLSVWLTRFGRWIDRPDPSALMHSSIFFDLHCVSGQQSLLQRLRAEILSRTRKNRRFQGHLAASALQFQPALAWHGGLRFRRGKDRQRSLDLKKFGVTPVVDLARVHALAGGHAAVGTRDRLGRMREEGTLSVDQFDHLGEAFETISQLRVEHQARRIRSGDPPDYLVRRSELSTRQQRRLRSSLRVVRDAQKRMSRRFGSELFQ
ncbi:MAG: cyclic nucleotide-binding protein [Wenzhouxiangella sp.]|nr:MAG: cyclic nucleotide-binding protein [Wenzhouxiangella sp.]